MRIKLNNINLNYEKIGQGYPLIMLHGNNQSLKIYRKLAKKLKNYFEIYLIDSRNHGKSDYSMEFSYKIMAEDIKHFIDKLNLKNPDVIGFSDGAIVATIAEIKYPGTFNKMALLGLNLSPRDILHKEYLKTKILSKIIKSKKIEIMLKEPNITEEELSKIKAKMLFIKAENDIFKDEMYEKIKKSCKNAKFLTITGHNHSSYIKNEDIIYKDLLKFFKDNKINESTKKIKFKFLEKERL